MENTSIAGNVYIRPALGRFDPDFNEYDEEIRDKKPKITGNVRFGHAKIGGRWEVQNVKFAGIVDMRNCHVSVLTDHISNGGWPEDKGKLLLDGFKYDALKITKDNNEGEYNNEDESSEKPRGIRHLKGVKEIIAEDKEKKAAKKQTRKNKHYIEWIERQYKNPDKLEGEEFRPQPYQQLTKVLRAQGHSEEADKVAIQMRKTHLQSGKNYLLGRLFQWALYHTCGFGYSGVRVFWTFVVCFTVGSVMYAMSAHNGFFGPADDVTGSKHETVANVSYVLLSPAKEISRGCPGHVAPLYTLDVIIPVIDLGQRRMCIFDPQGYWAPLWRALHMLFAIIGATLFAITIITLTGFMRRE